MVAAQLVLYIALVVVAIAAVLRSPGSMDVAGSDGLPAREARWRTTWVQVVVARYAEDVSWLANLPFQDILVYDKFDGAAVAKWAEQAAAREDEEDDETDEAAADGPGGVMAGGASTAAGYVAEDGECTGLAPQDIERSEVLFAPPQKKKRRSGRRRSSKRKPPPVDDHGNPPGSARVVRLPNVGRCDHTYLHHIVDAWDRLADVTIFVPGSCATSRSKWNKLQWIVGHVGRTGDSAFPVDLVTDDPVYMALNDFMLNSYVASAPSNAAINPESSLQLCRHRPYGIWYYAAFPELPPVHEVVYQGVFAVSRAHIRQHGRERYQRLLAYLDSHSNPEAGHYMERAWLAAFHPVPRECMSLPTDEREVARRQALCVTALVAALWTLWMSAPSR